MTTQFSKMKSSSVFFDVGVFLLSSLINGPSFMSISSLVLEIWQFFYKRLNRNPELETLPSEFCPISGDWGKLQISNLAQISLIKSYGILQNIRVTAFAVSELLRGNKQGEGEKPLTHTPRLGLSLHLRKKKRWCPLKCKCKYTVGSHDSANICIKLFSVKYRVHTLFAIVTISKYLSCLNYLL